MEVIVVCNHKGGVGKTTVCVNLAAELGRAGNQVLLIDTDPQHNLSLHVGKKHPSEVESNIDTLLRTDATELTRAIHQDTELENVSLIYSGFELENVHDALAREPRPSEVLADRLRPLKDLFDVVIIDTPPSIGLLTRNALAAATRVIVPIESGSQYSFYGIVGLLSLIDSMKRVNPNLSIMGPLLVRHDARTTTSRLTVSLAEEKFGHVIPVKLSSSTKVHQAAMVKSSVFALQHSNKVAREFVELADYVASELCLNRPQGLGDAGEDDEQ